MQESQQFSERPERAPRFRGIWWWCSDCSQSVYRKTLVLCATNYSCVFGTNTTSARSPTSASPDSTALWRSSSCRHVVRSGKAAPSPALAFQFRGRSSGLPLPDVKVVYTPHSYSFLRADISPLVRAGYLGAEYLLSRSPHTIAAISPHEAATAARLISGRASVTYLPNAAGDVSHSVAVRERGHSARLQVVTVGRISAQKDPSFLARVVERVGDPSLTWTGSVTASRRSNRS